VATIRKSDVTDLLTRRAWPLAVAMIALTALAGCEPPPPATDDSQAAQPAPTAPAPVDSPQAPLELEPVVVGPEPADSPAVDEAERARQSSDAAVVDVESDRPVVPVEPVAPETPPPPATDEAAPTAATAALCEEALSLALAGAFRDAHAKLASAVAPTDDVVVTATALLAGYLDHEARAKAEQQQEYDQIVARIRRAMLAQDTLDRDEGPAYRELLRERIKAVSAAYERVPAPDAVADVPADRAIDMQASAIGAMDDALAALAAAEQAAAGGEGAYAAAIQHVLVALGSDVDAYHRGWSGAAFDTPGLREQAADALRPLDFGLIESLSDAETMVSKQPWRMALVHAAAARHLMDDPGALEGETWYQALIAQTVGRGQRLMDEASWSSALAAFVGLTELEPDNEAFEQTAKRIRKHARVLGLYATGLADEDDSDEPDDDDDEASAIRKDLWKEMVQGVNEQMGRVIISRVASYYVTPVDYRKLINGALDSVRVLAETPQIVETFPSLADETARAAFVKAVDDHLAHVAAKGDPLDHLDLLEAMTVVLNASKKTVAFPLGVLVMEFTEGFLAELDEFSQPIWPNDVAQFDKMTRGHFVGVGIQVQKEPGEPLKVVMPIAGTPAFRAGIEAGDKIVAVDGVATKDLPIDKIIDMIIGKKDTTVVLRVLRRGTTTPADMPIVRDTIKIVSVKGWRLGAEGRWDYMLDPAWGIGYIRVERFSEETVADVVTAMQGLRRQQAKALILDMRMNPGGLLNAAVRVANEFVDGGQIVSTRGRNQEEVEFKANWRGQFINGPMVILIDEYSASASEIVSGALQDLGRAIVAGTRTYGKGSVQKVLGVSRAPAEARLKLTTAYYYVGPSENLVHRTNGDGTWGVQPDVVVRMTPQQIKRWLDIRRQTDLLHEVSPEQLEADLAKQYDADLPLIAAVTLLQLEQVQAERAASAAR